jgi:DNA-binding beta-propeller fold protein YncE
MRIAWLGLAAAVAVPTVSSCGTLGLIGAAAFATWPANKLFPPKPSRFRIGGTIRGLSGSVTLQLNEAEVLTRSKDGPFSFESPIENQGTFSVRVTELPFEQNCTLTSASGAVDGENIDSVLVDCALRTYQIGGTVTGLIGQLDLRINNHEALSITNNGPFRFQSTLPKGHTYEVTEAKRPQGQLCSISGRRGAVKGEVDTIAVQCDPFLSLHDSQAAARVIGQESFNIIPGATDSTVGRARLKSPWGSAAFANDKLYVSDRGAHRILVFNGLPKENGAPADFVLGQPDFQSMVSHSGREGFSNPESLSSDGERLAVADKGNHRVLVYQSLPADGSSRPTMVLGQPDFDTPSSAECNANSLSGPTGVFIGHGKLIVADTWHHRVLIWNLDSLENGKAADLVLGQTSFDSCAANDSDRDGGVDTRSASTLNLPEGVWTDGKRLLVADSGNDRVLIWEVFPTRNGEGATAVLGAPNFNSDSSGMVTSDQLFTPTAVTSAGGKVFVADHGNNRVLIWNQFPSVSGTRADQVLGQTGFTSRTQLSPPTNRSLYEPSGVLVAVPYLIVTDSRNKRLLMFESP